MERINASKWQDKCLVIERFETDQAASDKWVVAFNEPIKITVEKRRAAKSYYAVVKFGDGEWDIIVGMSDKDRVGAIHDLTDDLVRFYNKEYRMGDGSLSLYAKRVKEYLDVVVKSVTINN